MNSFICFKESLFSEVNQSFQPHLATIQVETGDLAAIMEELMADPVRRIFFFATLTLAYEIDNLIIFTFFAHFLEAYLIQVPPLLLFFKILCTTPLSNDNGITKLCLYV